MFSNTTHCWINKHNCAIPSFIPFLGIDCNDYGCTLVPLAWIGLFVTYILTVLPFCYIQEISKVNERREKYVKQPLTKRYLIYRSQWKGEMNFSSVFKALMKRRHVICSNWSKCFQFAACSDFILMFWSRQTGREWLGNRLNIFCRFGGIWSKTILETFR